MSTLGCEGGGPLVLEQRNGERVRIEVESNESALRIQAVLGSLGFDVIRDYSNYRGDLFAEVTRAAGHYYHLSVREQQVLREILGGSNKEQIAKRTELSTNTVKWHLHNLYFKLGVSSREEVLHKVLRLDDLCWLRAPRLQRDALEGLHSAALEVRAKLVAGSDIGAAVHVLDNAISQGHRLAGLPPLPSE